jgi:predicted adenine nucleotide alpha hydrolase (AANH) superfamily ATPase
MKIILHCCCAPCSVSCLDSLQAENIKPLLYWYNPNIHPYKEYTLRRDCLIKFANNEKQEIMIIDEYGLRLFIDTVYQQTKSFCEKCYEIRLEKTASFAAQQGYHAFTTTLLISPYQNHELIESIGKKAAEKYGVKFLYRDFRPLFKEGQSAARKKGMYMQNYCGCIFSEEERFSRSVSK